MTSLDFTSLSFVLKVFPFFFLVMILLFVAALRVLLARDRFFILGLAIILLLAALCSSISVFHYVMQFGSLILGSYVQSKC